VYITHSRLSGASSFGKPTRDEKRELQSAVVRRSRLELEGNELLGIAQGDRARRRDVGEENVATVSDSGNLMLVSRRIRRVLGGDDGDVHTVGLLRRNTSRDRERKRAVKQDVAKRFEVARQLRGGSGVKYHSAAHPSKGDRQLDAAVLVVKLLNRGNRDDRRSHGGATLMVPVGERRKQFT
jgi:hypothetical protein